MTELNDFTMDELIILALGEENPVEYTFISKLFEIIEI